MRYMNKTRAFTKSKYCCNCISLRDKLFKHINTVHSKTIMFVYKLCKQDIVMIQNNYKIFRSKNCLVYFCTKDYYRRHKTMLLHQKRNHSRKRRNMPGKFMRCHCSFKKSFFEKKQFFAKPYLPKF